MRRYHFDLVNTNRVTDAGGAILDHDGQARRVAEDLAQGVRDTRPELIGRGYQISVREENGHEVCRVAVDREIEDGG